jgi:hypothetical protein
LKFNVDLGTLNLEQLAQRALNVEHLNSDSPLVSVSY